MATPLIRKEPPARQPMRDWKLVVKNLKAEPGTWFLVAEDDWTSVASRLRSRYGLETRMVGVNDVTKRAKEIYARWPKPIERSSLIRDIDADLTKALGELNPEAEAAR